MKWLCSVLLFFTVQVVSGQDKFLELTIEPQTQERETLKKFSVMVVTTEGAIFEIETKRKKATFFLPAGEFYKLKIIKEGFFKSHIEIDLKEAPTTRKKSESLTLELMLISSEETQPTTIRKYKYEPRYAKIIRVFDEE
jgi:hypothetical protein